MTDLDSLRLRRARRVARVVTFSATLVGLAACGGGDSHTITDAARADAATSSEDAATPPLDAAAAEDAFALADAAPSEDAAAPSEDAAAPSEDAAAPVDAYAAADAGCTDFPPTTEPCCEVAGGHWDPAYGCAVAVPGPFVPPSMVG